MSALQAVLFDVDGVLCVPTLRFAAYLEREHGITSAHTREFFQGVFLECIDGKADLRNVLPAYLEQWPWPHDLDSFLARWFGEESLLDARVLNAMQQLRDRGIKCYLATNQEQHRRNYLWDDLGMWRWCDGILASSSLGVRKPEPAYFVLATQQLELAPTSIAFWDDTQANVVAAQTHGWQAYHYRDYSDLAAWLNTKSIN